MKEVYLMDYTTVYDSPLGTIQLASDGTHLIGLWLCGQKYDRATLSEESCRNDDLPVFIQVRDWLDRYFAGKRPAPSELPLNPRGSAFRQHVWQLLCQVPYGQTTTYSDLAERLGQMTGKKENPHAVGGAVGHNPISLIIPCHRAVGKSGSLTGYAGGLDKKVWLLRHEGADMTRLFRPGQRKKAGSEK
jgi:methylated-DNA-[protein]-cysteine S-methyltransferase